MGSNRKNKVKIKSVNKNQNKNFDDIIKNEIDKFIKEKEKSANQNQKIKDPLVSNQPDIINELRKEERQGKLKIFLEQNSNIEINKLIEISPKLKKNSYLEPDLNHNKSIIHSYEDAFLIAKRALYTIYQK
jgi:hypothetical protein